MRPYRGKKIDNDKWVYGWLFERGGGSYIIPITDEYHTPASFVLTFVPVIPETVGQQTGLKDKKRKEIYENNKVREVFRVAGHPDDIFEGVVTWWDSGWFLKTKEYGMISLTDGADELEIIHDKEAK